MHLPQWALVALDASGLRGEEERGPHLEGQCLEMAGSMKNVCKGHSATGSTAVETYSSLLSMQVTFMLLSL